MRLHSLCLGAAWVGVMLAMAMGFGPIVPTHAQGSGATGVDAGQIERRLQQIRPSVPTAPAPEFQAPPSAPKVEGEFSLVLTGVLIEGVTAFPVAEFGPLYAEFLVQSIGRAELDEIAVRITQTYTEAGFYLSRAIVPVQTIESGILRIRVIEGFLSGIRFEGPDKQDDLFDSYAALIADERPARLSTVERSLLLINGLPGVQVSDVQVARLDDGGAYELVVAIDYNMAEGAANLDNRGTPEVGRLQGWLSGTVNSVAGLGERLQVDFATVPDDPKELVYG